MIYPSEDTTKNSKPAEETYINALSVDVEEYFHANNLAPVAPSSNWPSLPHRADSSTKVILDILEQRGVKATFFVLGYVADRFPKLAREIAARGHEIASHGYAHRLAYEQTREEFFNDIERTKKLLEDQSGQRVIGYRAPSFSIVEDNLWAYDELRRAGYVYDSSLHPIRHPRYSNQNRSILPHRYPCENGDSILVLPLAAREFNILGATFRLPAAGGAYWRLLPKSYCQLILQTISRAGGPGFIAYTHPWEFDADQPVFKRLPWLTRRRHYGGISDFSETFQSFLKKFQFTTIVNYASKLDKTPELATLRNILHGS
jgi:polysaccharide deacetylase family protein (PEP-CTERM system associated)